MCSPLCTSYCIVHCHVIVTPYTIPCRCTASVFCALCRGDYFATVAPDGATQSVAVHQLSKQHSQSPFRKNRGRVTCTAFHPSKPWFFVATQNNVRVYNLAKQSLVKKLLAGGGTISSISVHNTGDHVLLGTEDNRCLWCVPRTARNMCQRICLHPKRLKHGLRTRTGWMQGEPSEREASSCRLHCGVASQLSTQGCAHVASA